MEISKVVVDEEELRQRFHVELSRSNAWKDLMPTNVGSTVMDMVAGATTINQHAIFTSLREAFLTKARRASSIHENIVSKGISLSRRTGSSTTARLTNNYPETRLLPVMSQFMVDGELFYNREQLVFAPGSTIGEVHLYQGEVFDLEFDLSTYDSLEFNTFTLGIPDFFVSHNDLQVSVENKDSGDVVVWNRTEESMFDLTDTDNVYYEFTTGSGDVAFLFGDGEFGAKLSSNAILHIRGVKSKGSAVYGISGSEVRAVEYPLIGGTTTTSMVRGSDVKDPAYYKQFGPLMARSRKKAISKTEVRGWIMRYPGVADVSLFVQRDIAPNDPRWQNVMRICILPKTSDHWGGSNPNPKSAQWDLFIDDIEDTVQALGQLQTWNPSKVYVSVALTAYIKQGYVVSEVKTLITERILKLFKRRAGILGRELTLHDINRAATVEGVDYIKVISPTTSITPSDASYYVVLDGEPLVNVVYTQRKGDVLGDS
jgi:hypothetical protein